MSQKQNEPKMEQAKNGMSQKWNEQNLESATKRMSRIWIKTKWNVSKCNDLKMK